MSPDQGSLDDRQVSVMAQPGGAESEPGGPGPRGGHGPAAPGRYRAHGDLLGSDQVAGSARGSCLTCLRDRPRTLGRRGATGSCITRPERSRLSGSTGRAANRQASRVAS